MMPPAAIDDQTAIKMPTKIPNPPFKEIKMPIRPSNSIGNNP